MHTVVSGCLFGYDVDASVVPLARLALTLLCAPEDRQSAAAAVAEHLLVADTLTVDPGARFPVVLANPPWYRTVAFTFCRFWGLFMCIA